MLPQLGEELFLTDGGMETWLIHEAGFELPQFASFPLLDSAEGNAALAPASCSVALDSIGT